MIMSTGLPRGGKDIYNYMYGKFNMSISPRRDPMESGIRTNVPIKSWQIIREEIENLRESSGYILQKLGASRLCWREPISTSVSAKNN